MPFKILVVDDSRTMQLLLVNILRRYEGVVLTADNGQEGLATAAREKPDLILLDASMPVMDGITMLAKLKDTPELRHIPVFMLSAEIDPEEAEHLIRLGAHDVMAKPFNESHMLARIAQIVVLQPSVHITSLGRAAQEGNDG